MIGMALFAVLMSVNFASCDKEEEEAASIYGEWRMVSEEYWSYEDGELDEHDLDEDFSDEDFSDKWYCIYHFNEDGTYWFYEGDRFGHNEAEGTYTYKNGKLTLDGLEETYEVITLTSSTMVWEGTDIWSYDESYYKDVYKMTFERVK